MQQQQRTQQTTPTRTPTRTGAGQSTGGPGNAALADQLQAPIVATGDAGDREESAADALAEDVLAWVGHADGALATDTPEDDAPRGGSLPEGFAAAFLELSGFHVEQVPIHEGASATTDAHDAHGMVQDNEVYLSGSIASDPKLLAHELAHVALGHAGQGAPIRRHAQSPRSIGISRTLRHGDRGSQVEALQTALVRLGYMSAAQKATGPGVFGRRTQASVMAFQRARRLTVDGLVGPQTIAALSAATTTTTTTTPSTGGERGSAALTGRPALKEGMEGVLVKEMQKALNKYGGTVYIDGEFGPATARAVRAFQAANGLTADGVVGPQTAGVLTGGSAKSVSKGGGQAPAPGAPTTVKVDVDDADPKGLLADSRINPTVRQLATTTIKTMQAAGHSPYVVGGFRSFQYQNDLYAQGRTKPGQKVTYVKGGGSWHNYGLAVDIVFWNKSHTGPSWDGSLPWRTLGNAGKAAGFTRWMGDEGWDYAHFEHHPSWGNGCTNLASTVHNEGLGSVWSKVL